MNRKMAAKELKPGMEVLYRLKWYTVVKYDAINKVLTMADMRRQGLQTEKTLHPSMIVTVKGEEPDEEDDHRTVRSFHAIQHREE